VVPTDASGIRALYQALGRGEAIAVLPDQQPKEEGSAAVFAPFFGQEALTMTLLSRLARKTGAAVLYVFVERLPRGRAFGCTGCRARRYRRCRSARRGDGAESGRGALRLALPDAVPVDLPAFQEASGGLRSPYRR